MAQDTSDISLVTRFDMAHNFGVPFAGGPVVERIAYSGLKLGQPSETVDPVLAGQAPKSTTLDI